MNAKTGNIIGLIVIFAMMMAVFPTPDGLAQTYTCPCSIWSPATLPLNTATTEALPVELGVQFRSSVAGYITAIRFYKGPGNTGDHYGHIWSTDGSMLGEVLFTNESDTGWQEAVLTTPVHILANTAYIAAYHSPNGHWSYDPGYFGAQGVTNEPLYALANGERLPGNGVYQYGPNRSFPIQSFGQTNYWVDVVFNETIAPDTTPPTVAATNPTGGATDVAVSASLTARFNEAMNAASVTTATVELRDAANNLVNAAISYTSGNYTVSINPDANLAYSSAYNVRILGGTGGVADLANNTLATDYTWSFTTADPPPPPPNEGPGGPILVIADAGNPFGRYYAEILRNEGLNEFTVTDISLVTGPILNGYDVVLLAEISRGLTAGEITLLTDWVTAGGNLITMRPDIGLAGLLGLTRVSGVLPAAGTLNAYMKIDASAPPGQGLVSETIQYHGNADLYDLSGATAIADLYSTAAASAGHPAVTLHGVGSSGGEAAAFAYDLARSVVYTRQGNPAWAGQNRDASDPSVSRIISHDLYYGNAPGDPQPDYIDWNKITIPQADEQMRLLARLIQHMNRDKKPLPHFWYFPRMEKAVVIMTGDDHNTGGTAGRFEIYKTINPGCNVAEWECVRASSYIFEPAGLTDALAAQYNSEGFEIGHHFNTGCVDWTPASLETFYASQLTSFQAAYPSIPAQKSQRTHCVTWTDWASQPKVQAAHGIRMDTNYYYYPPAWIQERPGLFTGSGMIMRFADLDGSLIDVYQAVTQMTDESSLQGYGYFNPLQINTLLDNAVGPNGFYGAFTANMHTDSANHAGSVTIINAAVARSVPVVSGRQMVTWLDGRNGSSFQNITWTGSVLSFNVQAAAAANGLRGLLPYQTNAGYVSQITQDGSPVPFTREVIKGIETVIFPALTGAYAVTYTPDTTAPVISGATIVPDHNGNATITWTTDEAGDSYIDYGTSADNLSLTTSQPARVTAHTITLTGLQAATTYFLRVSTTDLSGNTGRYPAIADPPASFTTPSAAFIDTTLADFSAGTAVSNIYITNDSNGEVRLIPALGSEFNGSELPTDWFIAQYPVAGSGGTAIVSGGVLTVDGARTGTNSLYNPGISLEFVATFTGSPYQHIGFGLDYNQGPWAIFSTDQTGAIFQARTNISVGGYTPTETTLSPSLFNTPHHFRIDWRSDRIVYFVDGQQVADHQVTLSAQMRPMAADYQPGGPAITVDSLRLSPYATPGTFQSRVFDAVGTATWLAPSWTANLPAGTQLSLSARTGNTATPDGSWSAFTPLVIGYPIGQVSRYIQYQTTLSTTDPVATPALQEITIGYTLTPDTTPPFVESRTPAANATNVALNTNIQVVFNEAMHPDSMNTANIHLRIGGSSSDLPVTITYANRVATINPANDLATSTVYLVTVAGQAADLSGNPMGVEEVWTFRTTNVGTFTDTTQADFDDGTPGTGVYLAETANGEVILAPTVGDEFNGPVLPAGWLDQPYGSGGNVTFSNGWLVVDGRKVGPNDLFGPGRWLEFVGKFQNGPYTHVGFGLTYDIPPWAIFSTDSTGAAFQTRSAGNASIDRSLTMSWNNVPHRYRIEWNADTIVFRVDGVQVDSHTNTLSAAMRPLISEFSGGGTNLSINWLRMGPYATTGIFQSRILDAGEIVRWTDLAFTGTSSEGTSLGFETRTSESGAVWTEWQAVNSPIASPNGRYLQYRASLSTNNSNLTPELESVTITYEDLSPTAVDMTDPTADHREGGMSIRWSTAQEINLIGFNVYRSTNPFGGGLKLNDTLILGQMSGENIGADYVFIDQTAQQGATYYYWIERVTVNGAEMVGPAVGLWPYQTFLPVITWP